MGLVSGSASHSDQHMFYFDHRYIEKRLQNLSDNSLQIIMKDDNITQRQDLHNIRFTAALVVSSSSSCLTKIDSDIEKVS